MAGEEKEVEEEKIPEGYTEEEWKDLSGTEKEGILENQRAEAEGEEEEVDGKPEGEPEKKPEEKVEEKPKEEAKPEEKKEVSSETPAAEAKPEDAPKPEEKPAEPPVLAAQVSDSDLLRFKPVIADSELPPINLKRSPELQAKIDDLRKKRDDGDITQEQYEDTRDELVGEHTIRVNAQRESARDNITWDKEQAHFFSVKKEYLEGDGHELLYGALNAAIKKLSPNFDHMELLVEADKMVKKQFGMVKGTEQPKAKVVDKPPAPLPGHKTLTDIPEAGRQTVGSVFAALDKLTGEALEAALEKLTPAQKEAYEAGR